MALFGAVNFLRNSIQGGANGLLMKRGYTQLLGQNKLDRLFDENRLMVKKCQEENRRMKGNLTGDKDCGVKSEQTTCHKDVKKIAEVCKTVKLPEWPAAVCQKVCVPCCKPINVPLQCDKSETNSNLCSGIDYKYASFADSVERIGCNLKRTDCCVEMLCRKIYPVGFIKPITNIKNLQKDKLGMPRDNPRYFSTCTTFYSDKKNNKKNDKEESKSGIQGLPCLKKSETTTDTKKTVVKGECKKLCMPCCKPARDPPDCFFPYVKPECKKIRAPRPAFSECQADKMKIPEPCECPFVSLPRCDQMTKGKDDKCAKQKKK